MSTSSADKNVVDRIVAKNDDLWKLLTDHSLSRDDALDLVDRIFPKAELLAGFE